MASSIGWMRCTRRRRRKISGSIFRDRTSAVSTYPAGRYLHAPLPVDGRVDLDFNVAYNPPCAFTEFATCPIPPKQNWLKVAIEAGEKDYMAQTIADRSLHPT